jgi:hypothetical protein
MTGGASMTFVPSTPNHQHNTTQHNTTQHNTTRSLFRSQL